MTHLEFQKRYTYAPATDKLGEGGFGSKTNTPQKKSSKKSKKYVFLALGVVAAAIVLALVFALSGGGGRNAYEEVYVVDDIAQIAPNIEEVYVVDDTAQTASNIEMVFVLGGTFTMGCTAEQGSDCSDWERPAHQVTLRSYNIGKYEVTQAQWEAVMGSNPSSPKGSNLPVNNVSWNDAQEFISKLNTQTGGRYRLPTEAEWEYAARGGNRSQNNKYSGNNNASVVAWYDETSGSGIKAVGTKQANELGIFDMSGNVWEWCNDWYGEYTTIANPQGPSSGSYRVIRGGSWFDTARYVRVSARFISTPSNRNTFYGLRLASSPVQIRSVVGVL